MTYILNMTITRVMKTEYKSNDSDYDSDMNINHFNLQIGIDEAGRGPLMGRVYTAAVVLPTETETFKLDFNKIKDSKRFTSEKRLLEAEKYVKDNAIFWSIAWRNEKEVDQYNILNCTHSAMKEAARNVVLQAINKTYDVNNILLLVDGNSFSPLTISNNGCFCKIKHVLVTKGDDTYAQIAAASILAKSARDRYIKELCDEFPELETLYDIRNNKGYGTKRHLIGIMKHGTSKWHRLSFAPCR